MKNLTNKFVLSVLSLVLTGVALSVGVYAWFTVNNTATVSAFTASVQTGEGFYVSLDGADWKSTITTGELETLLDVENFQFVALSSLDGIELTGLEVDGGELVPTAAVSAGFLEFDLLFAGSDSLDEIEITSLVLSSGAGTTWIPGVSVTGTRSFGAENDPITEFAANAARVSFTDILAGSPEAVVFQQSNGTNGNTLGKGAFASNEAVLFYNHFMDPELTEDLFDDAVLPTTLAANASLAITVGELYAHAGVSGAISALHPGLSVSAAIQNTIGSNYKLGLITVRVWIEGWDEQALNAILNGTLSVNFNFRGITA